VEGDLREKRTRREAGMERRGELDRSSRDQANVDKKRKNERLGIKSCTPWRSSTCCVLKKCEETSWNHWKRRCRNRRRRRKDGFDRGCFDDDGCCRLS